MITGNILNRGSAHGDILELTEPVSFWGAYDPRSGMIVDVHHPQCGMKLTGRILLLPETRGSGGTPGGIAEALRLGTAPAGIVLIKPDINLAIGAAVAARLYGVMCPVIAISEADYAKLRTFRAASIRQDGTISSD